MTDYTPEMPNSAEPDLIGFASTYASGTRIEPHWHEAHQLVHAISGAMWVSALGKLWVLPVGRALWIPKEVEHAIQCKGTVEMRTAYLSPAYLDLPADPGVISISALAREVLVRLASGADDTLRRHLGAILSHEIRAGSVEPFCAPLPTDERIAKLATHLRSDPASRRTVAEWAIELGFSERNLIRRIRSETGMTFRELRRQIRIMVAIEHLADGQSVTNVALAVGFETTSAFIEAFRVVTGQTPGQFTRTT